MQNIIKKLLTANVQLQIAVKLKKGDNVLVVSGKDRGKTGKILKVFPRDGWVLVEGVNIRKKHVRPRRSGEKGQVITLPLPLHISNVKLFCASCGKATRSGYRLDDGRKTRMCKKCGRET